MQGEVILPKLVSGRVRGHLVANGVWTPQGSFEHNMLMFDWATIVAELLRGAPDGKPYKIGGAYLEYDNNGGAPVSPPTFDRSGGIDYYLSLASSATRDYLRVPLTAADFESTDATVFPGGNKLTFFARTDGVVGVHGKPFSNAVSSRVIGAALVTYPDFGDATQDLVFSRFYWSDTSNQIVKATGSQIGIEWPITLQ